MRIISRTDKSILSRWWWSVDRLTAAAFVILAVTGIVLVSAASPSVAERIHLPPFYFVYRQILYLVPALGVTFAFSLMSRKTLWRIASLVLLGAAFLTALTPLVGAEVKGATRWISIFGISIQPSEFLKPAFAVVSAWLMARASAEENFPGQKIVLGLYLLLLTLLLLQPDLGMSFVLSCIWGAQVFLSGLPMLLIIGLGLAGLAGLFGAYLFFPHVTSRVDRFLDPATGDNYQVQKSLDAFANGGLFGTGPGHGQVKLTLPDAHADFIFAVAGEEFGMIAATLLIILFAFIIVRSAARAFKSDDLFVLLGAGGLLMQFGLQSLIHIGSSLQLLPAKGMTLPFISYGGSSMLAIGMGAGMLLALTRQQEKTGDDA